MSASCCSLSSAAVLRVLVCVLLDSKRPLHFPLGLTSVGPAQNGFESVESREVLKLPVQRGILLLQKLFDGYLLHVVVQD